MKEINSVPLEFHIACLVAAGLIVSVAYSVDSSKAF
jgi:hypothetical protein